MRPSGDRHAQAEGRHRELGRRDEELAIRGRVQTALPWIRLLGLVCGASAVLVVVSGRIANYMAYDSRHQLAEMFDAVQPRADLSDSPETFARWEKRDEGNVLEARQLGARIDLTFLGDSITEGWLRHPLGHHSHDGTSPDAVRDTFEREFGAWGEVTDWGIGGDRVQDLHWRLTHGLLATSWRPRAIVCLIGTNNLKDPEVAPEEVAGGIAGVMRLLTGHFPHSRVLILGVFPRAQRPWDPPADPHGSFVSFESLPRFAPWNETNPYYSKIRKINELLKEAVAAAGGSARFLDCSAELLRPVALEPGAEEPSSGPPLRADHGGDWVDREIFGDYLHLTPEGYKRWAQCLRPVLSEWKELVLPPTDTVAGVLQQPVRRPASAPAAR